MPIFINVSTIASFHPFDPSAVKFVKRNLISSGLFGGILVKRI